MMKTNSFTKTLLFSIFCFSSVFAGMNECHRFYFASGFSKDSIMKKISDEINVIDPEISLSTLTILSNVKITKLITQANMLGINVTGNVKYLIGQRTENKKQLLAEAQKKALEAQKKAAENRLPPEPTPVIPVTPPGKKKNTVRVEGPLVEKDITTLTYLSPEFVEYEPGKVYSHMPTGESVFFDFDINGEIRLASNPFPFSDKEIAKVKPGFDGKLMLELYTPGVHNQHIAIQGPDGQFRKSNAFINTYQESLTSSGHIVDITAMSNGLVLTSMLYGRFRIYNPRTDTFGRHIQRTDWKGTNEHVHHVHPLPNGDFIALHKLTNYSKQNIGLFNDTVVQYWKYDATTQTYLQAGHISDTPTTELKSFVVDDSTGNMYVLYDHGEIKTFQLITKQPSPPKTNTVANVTRMFGFARKQTPVTPPPPIVPQVEFKEIDSFTHAHKGKYANRLQMTVEGGLTYSTFEGGVVFLNKDPQGKLSYDMTLKAQANHGSSFYGFSNGTRIIKNSQSSTSYFNSTQWSKSSIEVELLDEEAP